MILDRTSIQKDFSQAINDLKQCLDRLGSNIWHDKNDQEKQELVDKEVKILKEALIKTNQLKRALLELKTIELANASLEEKKYLENLKRDWQDEEEQLSMVFGATKSPFIFEWQEFAPGWEKGITGLKQTPPIASKEFLEIIKKVFKQSETEFARN